MLPVEELKEENSEVKRENPKSDDGLINQEDMKELELEVLSSEIEDFEVDIYSLKNDSWRRIDYSQNVVGLINSSKFVNRKLHWATYTTHLGFKKGWNITSFDLADEKWRKVEEPYYREEGDNILVLGVLGSDLSMICNNFTTDQVDVWVMTEYEFKESWIKMLTIDYTL
ncbi:hypothetical protein HAX54_018001, partial [Datura stramonium]|nr:hypothetical protein [Datura stramonium]